MYQDSMQGIHDNLKTSWDLQHKQDHLVCFLAGSLMLGATTTGALTGVVSQSPDQPDRDWHIKGSR
ncbi:hypothetical protein B0H10DRAFT_2111774 [Mycena sp. CBHHK59/15]|nr:hypothetical protein B0H10DRAFT_2111774 [Mycena sp. CBHHK59/15]